MIIVAITVMIFVVCVSIAFAKKDYADAFYVAVGALLLVLVALSVTSLIAPDYKATEKIITGSVSEKDLSEYRNVKNSARGYSYEIEYVDDCDWYEYIWRFKNQNYKELYLQQ